jgi:ATP-binding cassette subfamily B protein
MSRALRQAVRLAVRVSPRAAIGTAVLGVLSGLAAAPASWLVKVLIDDLTRTTSRPSALVVGLLAGTSALLAGLAVAAAYASGIACNRLEALVQIETETTLAEACSRFVGTSFLDDPDQHDRLNLAQRGAHEAPGLVTTSVVEFVSSIAMISTYAVVLWLAWPLMLVAMLATAVPAALIQRNMSLRAVAVARAATASYRWRDYYAQLFTTPASARDMRLYGSQRLMMDRLRGNLTEALDQETRQQNRAAWSQIGYTLINAVIAAGGAAFLAVSAYRGRVTVGDFVLFTASVTVVQTRLSGLLRLASRVSVSLGAFDNYISFTADCRSNESTGNAVAPLRGEIEFRNVWFRYRSESEWVLRDVSLRLAAHCTHSLVGLNGAGKSSLVKLLLRFHEPSRGAIFWDGVDISTLDPIQLRRRMAGVLQDHVGYELSAVENITLGDVEHLGDIDRAREAAGSAGILLAIDQLRDGMDTMLSTSRHDRAGLVGTLLSGGQWQRLALARAMMRNDVDLLVLDEPNSGLDPAAEHELHQQLMGVGTSATRLLISHRLGGLRASDQIIVLDQGTVIERGSHDELMASNGSYARLYALQAETYLGATTV